MKKIILVLLFSLTFTSYAGDADGNFAIWGVGTNPVTVILRTAEKAMIMNIKYLSWVI